MDTITVASKPAIITAAAKLAKGKTPIGTSSFPTASYGCDHLQALFKEAKKTSISQYTQLVQTINERPSLISQTRRPSSKADGRSVVSITPTFLCLQCPLIHDAEARDRHYDAKAHSFAVESRSAYLYCQICQDYVYDPQLEEIRLQRGKYLLKWQKMRGQEVTNLTRSGRQKKRKLEDLIGVEDQKLIGANTTFNSCRAIGLRGFYNMGQTCFMSVIMQTLIHNPLIRNYYLGEGHKPNECDKEFCLNCAVDEIVCEFHSSDKTEGFGAVNMLTGSWMAAQALAGYQQQDAHEYMQFLLNALHSENTESSDSDSRNSRDCTCIIHKVFYGKLQSNVTCDKCRNVTTTLDPFMDLSLDIKTQPRRRKADGDGPQPVPVIELKECLERFTSKEKLAAADYTCQNCGGTQQNATKQLSIKRLPPVLPIHLKRFEHSKSASSKIETPIRFPFTLDLLPYTTRYKAWKASLKSNKSASNGNSNLPEEQIPIIFELSSVIVHKGKMDSGHYVSYSREGKDWFLFDDSKVVLVSEAEVLSANAYLLFYMAQAVDG